MRGAETGRRTLEAAAAEEEGRRRRKDAEEAAIAGAGVVDKVAAESEGERGEGESAHSRR